MDHRPSTVFCSVTTFLSLYSFTFRRPKFKEINNSRFRIKCQTANTAQNFPYQTKGTENGRQRNMQLILQHCFKTSSDDVRFTTHIKPVLHQIRLLTGLNVSGNTHNIAFQLVLKQCCKRSCMFQVVASFIEA